MPAVDDVAATLLEVPSPHLTDEEWIQSLACRKRAPQPLCQAARDGDAGRFAGQLGRSLDLLQGLKKSQRQRIHSQLPLLWDLPVETSCADAVTLAGCLFHDDSEEVCGCVETVVASHVDVTPEPEILIAACWLMLVRGRNLAPETLFSLWRWTLQSVSFDRRYAVPDVSSHFGTTHAWYHRLRMLELEFLVSAVASELRGVKKQARSAINGLRETLEEATDTDGTPVAALLPDILACLSSLARVTLLGQLLDCRGASGSKPPTLMGKGRPLWTRLNRLRLEGLLERAASLLTPWHLSFTRWPDKPIASGPVQEGAELVPVPLAREFHAIGTAFGLPETSGLLKLFQEWDRETATEPATTGKRKKRVSQWRLPEESHQSDWAEWGCLRSGWASPIDQVVLAHGGPLPAIDVVVRNLPLFSGSWQHQLVIDGAPTPDPEGWSCVCWFDDDEAAFMELQTDLDPRTRLIRQICLVRGEQILLLADAVHSKQARRIEYERSLPLGGHWLPEQDSRTREMALQDAGEWSGVSFPSAATEPLRVRLFPLTASQERVVRSEETTSLSEGRLVTRRSADASQIYVATLLDWSEKRRKTPVDWSALTVAEDGAILPPSIATAFRIRSGKQQWYLYHSLIPPQVPRTALGLHTSNETVFGRITSNGDVEPIVEVENETGGDRE